MGMTLAVLAPARDRSAWRHPLGAAGGRAGRAGGAGGAGPAWPAPACASGSSLRLPDPVRRFLRQMPAHLGGQAITRLNPLVDQLFAGLRRRRRGHDVAEADGRRRRRADLAAAGGAAAGAAVATCPRTSPGGELRRFRRHGAALAAGRRADPGRWWPRRWSCCAGRCCELLYLRGAMTPDDIDDDGPDLRSATCWACRASARCWCWPGPTWPPATPASCCRWARSTPASTWR